MSVVRKIAVFTSSRSEYGSFRGLIKAIHESRTLELCLIVSGSHLEQSGGFTKLEIEEDQIPISAEVKMFQNDSTKLGFANALGRELLGVNEVLNESQPDLILINGDRADLLPLATSAMCLGIPIAHIAGGEITEGAIDDSVRHAITKLSHLHFPTNILHAQRIAQMGEEEWRISVTGEPALDNILQMDYVSRSELCDFLGMELVDPVVLVTYHPETLGGNGLKDVRELLEAMRLVEATYVITYPNVDPGSQEIVKLMREFCAEYHHAVLVPSLGQLRYYSMLRIASLMLGNSSSGLWEAPSFGLPVVNVGGRQDGRLRAVNVIDVKNVDALSIQEAMKKALESGFKEGLKGMLNPYGNGSAIAQIIDQLESVELGRKLIRKQFVETNGC